MYSCDTRDSLDKRKLPYDDGAFDMSEGHLGRLLPACLHQAISDVVPARLEYYEEWLSPDGLRDGNIGLAPVSAVIGFLRTEGETYHAVVARAGQLAASWSVATLPALQRRLAGSLPLAFRSRFALRVAKRIVQEVLPGSRPSMRLRRGKATVQVQSSVFCKVRESQPRPMCAFYAALVVETLRCFNVAAESKIESCQAVSRQPCVMSIQIVGATASAEPAMAA